MVVDEKKLNTLLEYLQDKVEPCYKDETDVTIYRFFEDAKELNY